MPILDRANRNNELPESNGKDIEDFRIDADKGREPQFVAGQLGSRWLSQAAVVEHIEAAFVDEYENSPALREADSPTKKLKLLLDTANHIFAVESLDLSADDKAELISKAYSNLFGYGPLDRLLLDERVTTISLDGPDKASVRYGHGELESLGPIFQDERHFRRIIGRLLMDAGAELRDDQPYIETGLLVDERPVCVNLIAPPVAFQLGIDIRVHPKTLPTADQLISNGFMTEQAVTLLKALVESQHGFIVVGEPESGKTTLLSVLLRWLPQPDKAISVERAGELRLPTGAQRLMTRWPVADSPGITFGEQIGYALEEQPACIILDEVRSDEPLTIAPLLAMDNAPRQIWSFRGAVFAKRLQSALGMLARRADFGQGEEMVRALHERLPFVITILRSNGQLRLWSIGEWQFKDGSGYPTYTLLMNTEEGVLNLTGERPMRGLDLADGFWR
jgi:Flp pilus assembly CpaF family ATPase